ncbi:unnamed protein product [Adineta steineri]|uniref:Uncharacterized protein n=1 Tax=Adineta steineri TaxID=433720 RepID=A0A820AMN7_9BILA|nr:unnamed protein product [Adineta steineri]CAF4178538.1 unnamed protein product [Adineta steineri]
MPSTSNLQVRSTSATTTEIIQSSIILNNKENQSPTSPQSIPLIIDEQEEQQPSDNPLIQVHEPEQMDIAIETPSISSISSRIEVAVDEACYGKTYYLNQLLFIFMFFWMQAKETFDWLMFIMSVTVRNSS